MLSEMLSCNELLLRAEVDLAISSKALQAFDRAERALNDLRKILESEDEGFAGNQRWLRLLTVIEGRGGRVSGEDWAKLGKKCGYDTRGLGGFYRGANASMRRIKSTDERELTAAGRAYLEKWGRVH
jgi:hypothetical protein